MDRRKILITNKNLIVPNTNVNMNLMNIINMK